MRMVVFAAAMALCVTAASAADFDKVIVGMDGTPVCESKPVEGACPDGDSLTVGKASRNALGAMLPDEQNMSGDEKYKRAELAMRLKGVVVLKSEDIALIKKLVGRVYAPIIVLRVYDELEAQK